MKKLLFVILLSLGLYVTADAGTLQATTPFGSFTIDDAHLDGITMPADVYLPGSQQQTFSGGGSFPVYFDTADGVGSFTLHFGPGATMEDIIGGLCKLFNLTNPIIIVN